MTFASETKLRVRYAETDQMGIVYHSNRGENESYIFKQRGKGSRYTKISNLGTSLD